MQNNTEISASAEVAWIPPLPSSATREVHAPSKGACRPSIVGGARAREIRCESGLEKKAALFLLTHPHVTGLREQPPPVEWLDMAGVRHRHTFDFLADLKDGRRLAVAVKPQAIAERNRFSEQLSMIAAQVPVTFADGILLLTDADLPRDLVADAALMHQARRAPDPEVDNLMLSLATQHHAVSIAELVRASGLGGVAFRSLVRMISVGALNRLDGGRIGYPTRVAPIPSSVGETAR
ncbi:hypothetical protein GGC47_003956 [Bosea sp. OAE752]|uniref:hypothetical protein n=1 Tax=Bosea sp. OAE752 TaxID=2663873 RepID=UPI003D23403F